MVSIVIPTYNCRHYLQETLNSLQAQTYQDFEVLLVDDCSTDDTRQFINDMAAKEPRFKPVFLERNLGPAAARNHGIGQACGDFIAFVDSDDYWAPEKLEKQLQIFAAHPAVGICATNGYNVDADGQVLSPLYDPTRARNGRIGMEEYLLSGLPVVTSSVMVPRQLLLDVGPFKEAYKVAEDYELWFRVLRRAEIFFLEEPLTYYRLHGQNVTGNKLRNRLSKIAVLENEIIANPEVKPELGPAFWLDLQRKYTSLGKMLLQDGQKDKGRHYLDKSIALNCNMLITLKSRLYRALH